MRADTARAAAMSDPNRNWHFRRGWVDPPPQKRKGRPLAGAALSKAEHRNSLEHTAPTDLEQRHLRRALERARRLDRAADIELIFGRHRAAERLACQASELREMIA